MINSFRIKNVGSGIQNHPVQIARLFRPGEITRAPTVAGLPSQYDFNQFYPDNSLKHAVLSFYLEAMAVGVELTYTVQNGDFNEARGLTQEQMLSGVFADFDASIILTKGRDIGSWSARDAIRQGLFRYWTYGPVCTTVIVRPPATLPGFQPFFHVAFWPAIGKANVRFVGEQTHSEKIGDLEFDAIHLKVGDRVVWQNTGEIPNPINPPQIAISDYGSLPAGTYWVGYTWVSTHGETQVSSPISVSLFRQGSLVISHPTPGISAGIKGWNAYIKPASFDLPMKINPTPTAYGFDIFVGETEPRYGPPPLENSTGKFWQGAATRWTKSAWWPEAPIGKISIDHNLNYLKSTKIIPNYDSSLDLPTEATDAKYTVWSNSDHDIFESGLWDPNGQMGGEHPAIGPIPEWDADWLVGMRNLDSAWKLEEIARGQAELMGSWPYHYREGRTDKNMLRSPLEGPVEEGRLGSGFGRVLSVCNRPKLWMTGETADDPVVVGSQRVRSSRAVGYSHFLEWVNDLAHFPDIATTAYLLTGDFYYLEESWFHNGYAVMATAGADPAQGAWRGPTGAEGALDMVQPRGAAWQLRSRSNCRAITPDFLCGLLEPDGETLYPMLENRYFDLIVEDAIAGELGGQLITDTPYANPSHNSHAVWKWAYDTRRYRQGEPEGGDSGFPLGPPPLGQIYRGFPGYVDSGVLLDNTYAHSATTFEQFLWYAYGRALELGWEGIRPLFERLAGHYFHRILSPQSNPVTIGVLATPTLIKRGEGIDWARTWEELTRCYWRGELDGTLVDMRTPTEDFFGVYPTVPLTALWCVPGYAMAQYLPEGYRAWTFIQAKLVDRWKQINPWGQSRWFIVPR